MSEATTLVNAKSTSNKSEKHDFLGPQEPGDAIINIDPTDSRATTAVNIITDKTSESKEDRAAADAEVKETVTIPLDQYERGYPRLAAFQSSDSCFSIYRSFGYLHSRVILELQDELRCLEDNLGRLDRLDSANGRQECVTSRLSDLKQAKRDKSPSKRAALISEIRGKLINYDEIVAKARELNTFQRPSRRDYISLKRWFFREKPLTYVREKGFVKRKEDLVTLRHGREWAGFDGLVEDLIRKIHCSLIHKIFATPELRAKTKDECVIYYSSNRIGKLVGLIITFIIFVLLVLPVVAMYKLTCIGIRRTIFDAVGILVVFTLLFSAAMGMLTKAKRHELFAASAAYCAVLVVFISNFGGPDGVASKLPGSA